MIDSESFAKELAGDDANVAALLADHLNEYGELLTHVFMGDVSRYVAHLYRDRQRGTQTSRDALQAILAKIEHAARFGDEDVKELVSVSFLENLVSECAEDPSFRALLGPSLKRELNLILTSLGYTDDSANQ